MSLSKNITRRDFIKTTAAASLAAAIPGNLGLFAAGSDALRIGVIGCGGRGTGAAINCLEAAEGIEIVALGDLVPDRIESSYRKLMEKFPDRVRVPAGNRFTGFDNHLKVCALPEVNLIVTAAPPGFRPIHLKAAVEAGKHVFMEKPVAVDPAGVRAVIASSEAAAAKGLAVVAGTQRRHQKSYLELMRRIRDGQIGEIVGAQCYWNQGDLWVKLPEPGMSEMEWQCRNWLYFTWTSGDHIVEQHVHNIDVVNWAIGALPKNIVGMGGREVRKAPEYGNIYDHFAVEFEYPNGVRVASYCRQTEGCADRVEERIIGTKGTAFGYGEIKGEKPWTFEGPEPDPYVQEHADLVASIRAGTPLNEGRRIAESTMCAIIGRMSAYTGRAISWDWAMNASKLDLSPARYEFGPNPVDPVAVPGKTPLI
ncbi:MAG: Gfo/Idh/MocA family oxidoreductase [Acidobacteriota bacterium]|jgi:Predicted dehydrogenases and related proteins|nr:Gfo/Idh/MocA family oxidoreductase [Acidobacteriota bacterium]HNQ79951.1 Gfo/Idh/MocA family oxidoreductase [Candidatus Aminicenantes bacterium]MDD8011053.1 Gfo/Idh/MocA family oxidoreductase [Acidobacteriota bacterium]MDD8028156.1 Gfo/Idh/MocA family oxidoreductase [Acidobacteriota bacterium]MDD8034149.1 Gfo/Idh/MocA family oxidoreductase [Acidobacteriota bacterium]